MIAIEQPRVTRPLELPGARLISRPKLVGLGIHYGVRVNGLPRFADVVFDFTDQGVRVILPEEFARGRPVRPLKYKPFPEALEVIRRADELLRQRPGYGALYPNCEHAARWVFDGKAESTQVNGVVGMSILFGLLWLGSQGGHE